MLVPIGRGIDNLPTHEIASSTATNSCVAAGFGSEIVYHSWTPFRLSQEGDGGFIQFNK